MALKHYLHRSLLLIFYLLIFICQGFGQNDYKLKSVSIHGNKKLGGGDINAVLSTKSKTLFEKLTFWSKSPRFSMRDFNDDLKRIERLYQRNGFLTSKVDYKFRKDEKAKTLKIDITIKEGEPVIINRINFESSNQTDQSPLLKDIQKELPIHQTDRFSDEKVISIETLLKKKYSDNGYPFASVERKIDLLPGNLKADLNFKIVSGEKVQFGKTTIQTDSVLPSSFVRNRLKYSEGEPYSKKMIAESQQKLYDTELFKYVVIRTETDSMKNGTVPISIHYKEKEHWTLRAGAGYGSEDKTRFSAEVTRRHFLGGARKLIFTGKSSYLLPVSIEVKFIQPDFLINNLNLIENPYYIKQNESSYRVERIGGSSTFQYNFSKFTNIYLSFSDEQVYFELKNDELANVDKQDSIRYNKSGFTFGFSRNTSNDLFNPETGYHFNSYATVMGIGLNSRYHYLKLEFDYRKYFKLPNNVVFAGRIRTGWIKPIKGDETTPIEDRYMLGGTQSLRGWGRNQLSPVDEKGNYVGGNSMLESSSEIRFPLFDMLSGAVFTDVGNVWAASKIPNLLDLHMDMGVGLRFNTPIGPIRSDFAVPLFEGTPHPKFFITIGHAF